MHVLFKETFSVIGRHTVVVDLFSALEVNLNEFCNAVQRRFGLASGVREANGKGLDRVKTYLKPTAVGFPSDEPFWSPIKSAQQTRDVLTHCLGYLNVDNPKHIDVAKYINQRRVGTVERYARAQLNVNEQFISELIVHIRALYRWLLKALETTESRTT